MSSRSLGCIASVALSVLALALGAASCQEVKKLPPKGELVLAFSTDVQVPKDMDKISVQIIQNGLLVYTHSYDVGPGEVLLPATLALSQGTNPEAAVRVRLIGWSHNHPRVIREAETTVPSDRVALIQLPLSWLCWGTAKEQVAEDGTTTVVSTCGDGKTCKGGECASVDVDQEALPDYDGESLFGDAGESGGGGDCFDTVACFASGWTVSQNTANCTFVKPSGIQKLSVAVVRKSNTTGICGPDACLIPLNADGPGGWSESGGTIHLPSVVCTNILNDPDTLGVAVSGSCDSKRESLPTCGPWSSADGSQGDFNAPGPDASAIVADAGDDVSEDASKDVVQDVPLDTQPDVPQDTQPDVAADVAQDAGPGCGNGVLESNEYCDDGNTIPGDGCDEKCYREQGWVCSGVPSVCHPKCGDKKIVGDEVCDSINIGTQDCLSVAGGFKGGQLKCAADCSSYDTSDCFVTGAKALLASESHSCGVLEDGTVWCWGYNKFGALGDGTTTNRHLPTKVSGLLGVKALAVGDNQTCIIKQDATMWCWGYNKFGQLGDGTNIDRDQPVLVKGLSNVVATAVQPVLFTCAVKQDGSVWCWGYNEWGQLGNGNKIPQKDPVQVSGLTGAVLITTSKSHVCVVLQDKTVRCWGAGTNGQLGDGNNTAVQYTPVQVTGLTAVTQITAAIGFTCALTGDGSVWCWGYNGNGRLGIGNTTSKNVPVQVPGVSSIVDISSGGGHTCAVKQDGTLWCWGYGFGTSPAQVVSGLTDIMSVSCGVGHTCALRKNGSAWCWGENQNGELGDGTTKDSTTPVRVAGWP